MTWKLIMPLLAALPLAGCGGGGHPPDPVAMSAAGKAQAPATGFIGPDGPLISAPPEVNHALETALVGRPVSWTDADSGAVTRFTVARTFQREDNTYCRDFTESVSVKDNTDTARGTACRQPDGTWRAVAG
jgi:hypothetical protein